MAPGIDERTRTTRRSDNGEYLIVVERWLDRQVSPPRWRSKNWRRKLTRELTRGEREYLDWLAQKSGEPA